MEHGPQQRPWIVWLVISAAMVTLGGPGITYAAEITDVVDAFDEEINDPFDFHFEPTFRQYMYGGTIVRERNCTPDQSGPWRSTLNAVHCPTEPTIIYTRELEYERVISELDLDFQFGLFRDLEFHVTLPIIFSDRTSLDFAVGESDARITQANSSVDPADTAIQEDLSNVASDPLFTTYRFFDVASADGIDRSGLGDMVFGLAWAPFNSERNPHVATLKFGIDYHAPTAEVATRTSTGPGHGLHQFEVTIAASRRFSIVEPYVAFHYFLPIPTSGSLFEDFGGGQSRFNPGMRGEIFAGAEFIVFENPRLEQSFTVDLGVELGFQAEGRDYTPLTDAFMQSACNGTTPAQANYGLDGQPYQPPANTPAENAACAWITQQPSLARIDPAVSDTNYQYFADGITSVESFATINGRLGLNFQISKYVEIRLATELGTETEHFLTTARTGRDRDGDDEVDFSDPNERNPVYNPTIDGVGHRFRAQSIMNFAWNGTLAFQF